MKEKHFTKSMIMKLNSVLDRGAWEVVCKEDIPKCVNIMNGCFVIFIKNEGAKNEVWKARFILERYRDKLNGPIRYNSAKEKKEFCQNSDSCCRNIWFSIFHRKFDEISHIETSG